MELRIKDIIRFIGVEYRIWFETEKELLSERKQRDTRIYLEVLQKIRSNLRKGEFNKFESQINYSRPILIFLQKAIKKYNLKKQEMAEVEVPSRKSYTLLKGKRSLTVISGDTYSFNEDILSNKDIVEACERVDFDQLFKTELKDFANFDEKKKETKLRLEYFNDTIDKLVNSLLDYINVQRLSERYSNIPQLEATLEEVKDKCGSTTEKVVRQIKLDVKNDITNEKVNTWTNELKTSFRRLEIQQKITSKSESLFGIGFIEM